MQNSPSRQSSLIQDIKAGKIAPIYLIAGEEAFLVTETVKQLLDLLLDSGSRDFNLDIFDGSQISVREILSAVEVYPVIADWRVVLVNDPDFLQPTSPLGISHFDLAILPRMYWHQPEHSNVCRTLGVPNRITPARLATFQLEDHQYLSPGRPKIGLLIGGTDRYYTIAYHTAINLLQSLAQLISTGGWQLLLSTSRRTPIEVADLIATTTRNQLDHFPIAIFAHQQLADSQGFKVEHILAYADLILVTEDSFSMVCEAASSGKPVLILKVDRTQAEWRYRKQDQIYQELVDRQIVQWAGEDPKSLVEKVAGEAQVGNPPSYLQDASLAAKAVANLLASDSNLTTRTENRSTT